MRRVLVFAMLLATATPTFGSSKVSGAIVETPVSFSVVNTNTSRTGPACTPDGKAYTIRGTIAGPASKLVDGTNDAVTLYIHGSGDGSSWNFTGFPGVDHIGGMAELGHVSVFIHFLGYGTSDAINGWDLCYGSQVDMAHQVVQHLRSGTFEVDGHPGPAFERVALAGHSGGALGAEQYSVSYDDIDAVVIAGWADAAVTFVPLFTKTAAFVPKCARGGRSKGPGGPAGWGRVFSDRDLDRLLYNVAPDVKHAFFERYEDEFCGLLKDAGPMIATNVALSPLLVDTPVLLIYGDHDPFLPGSFQLQKARYLSSKDVSVEVLTNAGHNAMMGRTAPQYRAVMSSWLKARGF